LGAHKVLAFVVAARLTIFVLLASLFFPSCATTDAVIPNNKVVVPNKLGSSVFQWDIINAFKNTGKDSIISAFKGVPELRASKIQKTYFIQPGKQAKLDVLISNQMSSSVKYVVLCFINYRQIKYQVGQYKLTYSHELSVASRAETEFQLTLPMLQEDAYNVLVVALRLDNISDAPGSNHHIVHRANLYVGEKQLNYFKSPEKWSLVKAFRTSNVAVNNSIKIDNLSHNLHNNPVSNDPNNIYLHVRNVNEKAMTYKFIYLTDFRQYPLDGITETLGSIAEIEPGMSRIFDISKLFSMSRESMEIIVVEEPFLKLEMKPGVLTQAPSAVIVTNRVKKY